MEAIISAIGVLVTAAVAFYKVRLEKHKTEQAIQEMRFQRASLDFGTFLGEWEGTHKEIVHLLETTEVDRFMILRAWNGVLEPRWTTAVFQMRAEGQMPVSYVHFELDTDYIQRLAQAKIAGGVVLKTEDLPPSAIKEVYAAEGVTEAFCNHIETLELPESSCKAVTYCSYATHDPEGMSEETVTKCRILTGRLKGISYAFPVERVE